MLQKERLLRVCETGTSTSSEKNSRKNLRRDVEATKGEDEGDFIDAREPPEPFCSPLDEPFRPARALNAVTSKRDRG